MVTCVSDDVRMCNPYIVWVGIGSAKSDRPGPYFCNEDYKVVIN